MASETVDPIYRSDPHPTHGSTPWAPRIVHCNAGCKSQDLPHWVSRERATFEMPDQRTACAATQGMLCNELKGSVTMTLSPSPSSIMIRRASWIACSYAIKTEAIFGKVTLLLFPLQKAAEPTSAAHLEPPMYMNTLFWYFGDTVLYVCVFFCTFWQFNIDFGTDGVRGWNHNIENSIREYRITLEFV